jgi:hypothetical protein
MKVYKDRQFLVFEFEDGKTVKYDFATKTCIGKRGLPVTNLCTQLKGVTIAEMCDCCVDKQYGKFLRFVQKHGDYNNRGISNIGTILNRVPHFAQFEQIFSAGIEEIVSSKFSYTIGDIPKGLIKLCQTHSITLSNTFLKFYKENPDAYLLAYNLMQEYVSLTDSDIYNILSHESSIKEYYGERTWDYRWVKISTFNKLMQDFNYNAKSLLMYIDNLKTYEAIDDMGYLINEIYDYASMMHRISHKFDKYPKHFLTTHKIASRNYNRLKEQFVEEDFKKRIDDGMEKVFGDYCFIYPRCTQDIKDEAVQQNNCVASYIKKVIDGESHILFLRKKEQPDKSLVTIEVRNGKIVQALQRFNHPLTDEQKEVVDKWNKWYSKKNESEELKNVS